MEEEPSETDFADAFSSFSEEGASSAWDETEGFPDSLQGLDPSLAVDLARFWVKEHQKATMLGAFGVGVFIGVLIRD